MLGPTESSANSPLDAHRTVAIPGNGDELQRPLNVAYLMHSFGMGGLERCVARLANDLDRQRFRPILITLNVAAGAAAWVNKDEVPIISMKKSQGNDWRLIGRLADVLRDHHIDLVHSHNWGTLLETVLARQMAKVPLHVHAERGTVLGRVEQGGVRLRFRGFAANWGLRQADAVMSNAHAVAARIAERCNFARENIQVIPNGVEVPPTTRPGVGPKIREQLAIPKDALVIGSIGRLAEVKGFEVAIQATVDAVARGYKVHLLIVGEGPQRAKLTELAESGGISQRVHFVGQQEVIGDFLAAMDVYVNVSHSEGMSQSLVEAMAAGLPLIATDVGDSALVLGNDSKCGRIVPPADPVGLSAAVVELANPALRKQFALQARERHRREFSSETMIQRYEQFYLELAATRKHLGAMNR